VRVGGASDEGTPYTMCSVSEAGSYVRLIDCVYHSTLGVRVIKKRKTLDVRVGGRKSKSSSETLSWTNYSYRWK